MVDTGYITKESALSCFSDWIDRYGHEHTADEMVEYQKIENLPAADVRPVVRGHWERSLWFVTCSVCEYTSADTDDEGDDIALNFCPNCGADMR